MTQEALKLALEKIATVNAMDYEYQAWAREALAQEQEPDDGYCKACDGWKCTSKAGCVALDNPSQRTEQEPEAWYDKHGMVTHDPFEGVTPLYLTPPQRKPLTDEQIDKLPWEPHEGNLMTFAEGLRYFARAIEAAHGIWPENSDCYGPDWTDRDGEYLK